LHSDMIANAQKFRKNDSNGFWTRSKLHSDMIANAQKEEANEA
jgi:hypothetical protein